MRIASSTCRKVGRRRAKRRNATRFGGFIFEFLCDPPFVYDDCPFFVRSRRNIRLTVAHLSDMVETRSVEQRPGKVAVGYYIDVLPEDDTQEADEDDDSDSESEASDADVL